MSKNPWADRWNAIHSKDSREERALAKMEADYARDQEAVTCKCGESAHYRPGVGAYQCSMCRSVRVWNDTAGKYEWR